MSDKTSIGWTDSTWNPVVGCDKVSSGCAQCYAVRSVWRMAHNPNPKLAAANAGLVVKQPNGVLNWTGKVNCIEDRLTVPLSWKNPRRVFVNSQSDLFHEDVPFEFVDKVFAVMALAPQHTFQILTKRPVRMLEYLDRERGIGHDVLRLAGRLAREWGCESVLEEGFYEQTDDHDPLPVGGTWPLPNVWLGVSVEDQPTADARIPLLLQTPAAVRFVSYEPALGPVDFSRWLRGGTNFHVRLDVEGALRNRSFSGFVHDDGRPMSKREAENELFALHRQGVKYIPTCECDAFDPQEGCSGHPNPGIDWVIVGGESGPNSRPFNVEWARQTVQQCKESGVACFVKQMGSKPFIDMPEAAQHGRYTIHPFDSTRSAFYPRLKSKKGDDPSEWPADLRVQEYPA